MTEYVKNLYEQWLEKLPQENLLRFELLNLTDNEIEDSFYTNLAFGTAGLRGIMGPGTNRMNTYTVAQATQGFAEYLIKAGSPNSVAISYDSRLNSKEFAELTACVMAANGIKAYIFPVLTPTPMLSYAVRYLHCSGGVMITASHNPKEYNGYKAYGPDGCQIDEDTAAEILNSISEVDMFSGVKFMSFTEALTMKTVVYISKDVNEAFYNEVLGCISEHGVLREAGLRVLYTPLNGTGLTPITHILHRLGLQHLSIVPEQENPDCNFTTCPKPNPEFRETFNTAMVHAAELHPDIVIASDPDADRVACAVLHDGSYFFPTGNEMGVLFIDYILARRTERGTLPKNPLIVRSIVSTPMADQVAADYGCSTDSVLTGFKNIAGRIRYYEEKGEVDRFLFGFEESIGYMFGSFVRDKDAVSATAVLCEMASWHKMRGHSLKDALNTLYEKYGYTMQRTENYIYEGEEGVHVMARIMAEIRIAPPTEVGGKRVQSMTDLQIGLKKDLLSNRSDCVDLPQGNVLIFTLEDNCSFILRPSGTEPKLKLYCSAAGTDADSVNAILTRMCLDMDTYCKK